MEHPRRHCGNRESKPSGAAVKNPESACSAGDEVSIPGLGRSPREGNDNPLHAWRIPWTSEPGELQAMELQRVDTT